MMRAMVVAMDATAFNMKNRNWRWRPRATSTKQSETCSAVPISPIANSTFFMRTNGQLNSATRPQQMNYTTDLGGMGGGMGTPGSVASETWVGGIGGGIG